MGDVDAPPVPQGLVATVAGSDVTLTWQPVTAPDLAGYVVRRDGVTIATAPDPSLWTPGRPNGTYTYTVRARDAAATRAPTRHPRSRS